MTSDWTHYMRITGGGVEDHIKNTSSAQVTAEWLPVNWALYIERPFQPIAALPITARFEPTLVLRYDDATGAKQILGINGRHEAFRLGPQAAIKFLPTVGTEGFFSRINGSFAFHWEYETYTQSYYRFLTASLSYNLDPKGYFALTGSYQYGQDEDTGAATDVYKISLTGKI